MFTRPFDPVRFLLSVYGTPPFLDYCKTREIGFEQAAPAPWLTADAQRWAAALSALPHERRAQVELELATVNEMAGEEAVAHLLEAAQGKPLPPDSVPSGAPVALWFFLYHPLLFREVFLHHEVREAEGWRVGRSEARIELTGIGERVAALGEGLRQFFRPQTGSVRFCTLEVNRLPRGAWSFVGQIADRLRLLDAFTDSGQVTTERLRPALPMVFVYEPADGTVLLKSPLRSHDRAAGLFRLFGAAVLRSPVRSDASAFDLEPLKGPFHPLPDAHDMELVRVKALHLRYPGQAGRRQLKLETLSSDEPSAIDHLLHTHIGAAVLSQLQVTHAELQVKLRVGGRSKNYSIRLWPDRCGLNQTPLGERLRACLKRWGLCHER